MQTIVSNIQEFRGSHYDYGVLQAQQLKETPYMANRNYEWLKRRPKFSLDYMETKSLYQKFAPAIWEELRGLQDELKISDMEVLLNLAHYRVSPRDSGCSIYFDDHSFIRNYDYHPSTYDGMYKLFQPEQGFAHIGPASRVTGRMDGMNEQGLVMGYNFMNRKQPFDGFTCFIIGRFILELCESTDDARQLLKELPHRGGFSYVIQDKNDDSFIAETSARGVAFRNSNVCTNHYELLDGENRRYLTDSLERLTILESAGSPSKADLIELFTDRRHGLFVDNYKSWAGTIHTSFYDKNNLIAGIRLGENTTLNEFDFKSWLHGNPLGLKEIKGILETDLKFTNADWQKTRSR
ncbi:MAG TPA: acyl-CoA--6-aminopenicillanic acid acyltransferase [Candidatus Salinicoccus stercoripullorum]|uniref:Acyl-CoA--6-aminopenicillanic acid acyltransferase n=1 Tax=Candidatus Salinicoccus stercoripullorum TaxID=2838756 RepID=A0A9D1U0N5_9STAP|nr:acyl-CoA--6-aminopenicillanic acid acyltransferase [Candidatus Salinicoccus stercoripullorum]